MPNMLSYDGIMTIVKDWFGLIGVLLVAVSAIGFSVSTPWPARADVENIQRQLGTVQDQIKSQNCLVLRLLLKSYEDELDQANAELKKNPDSFAAQKNKAEAETTIADIKAQIKTTCGLVLPTQG